MHKKRLHRSGPPVNTELNGSAVLGGEVWVGGSIKGREAGRIVPLVLPRQHQTKGTGALEFLVSDTNTRTVGVISTRKVDH